MRSAARLPTIAVEEAHRLEFFGDGCPACERYLQEIELGKCFRVDLSVHRSDDPAGDALRAGYGVTVAPTVVIDGRVKIEGRPGPEFEAEYGEYDDCRAALGVLLRTAPPLPAALRVGATHPPS